MLVIKKGKNKFQVDDDELAVDVSALVGKEIKSMKASEKDALLVILAQMAGICDKTGKAKKK